MKDFPPFKDLSDEQASMASMLFEAHFKAAKDNDNLSKGVYCGALAGSGNEVQAVSAALLTTGSRHAPVIAARQLIFEQAPNVVEDTIKNILRVKGMVPGFGNSFFKDRIDPAFQPVFNALEGSMAGQRLDFAWRQIPKKIFPNAAGITAAVAYHCGLPSPLELWFFIAPRTAAWLSLK